MKKYINFFFCLFSLFSISSIFSMSPSLLDSSMLSLCTNSILREIEKGESSTKNPDDLFDQIITIAGLTNPAYKCAKEKLTEIETLTQMWNEQTTIALNEKNQSFILDSKDQEFEHLNETDLNEWLYQRQQWYNQISRESNDKNRSTIIKQKEDALNNYISLINTIKKSDLDERTKIHNQLKSHSFTLIKSLELQLLNSDLHPALRARAYNLLLRVGLMVHNEQENKSDNTKKIDDLTNLFQLWHNESNNALKLADASFQFNPEIKKFSTINQNEINDWTAHYTAMYALFYQHNSSNQKVKTITIKNKIVENEINLLESLKNASSSTKKIINLYLKEKQDSFSKIYHKTLTS